MTIADRATRLTARVAPYRDAISAARKAGLTWGDIAVVLGVKTPDRLRWAVAHSEKYEAEQIPLPVTIEAKGKAATSAAAVVKERISRPLPGQEKTPEENAADLVARGIKVY